MITRLLTIEELELFDAVFVGGGDTADEVDAALAEEFGI